MQYLIHLISYGSWKQNEITSSRSTHSVVSAVCVWQLNTWIMHHTNLNILIIFIMNFYPHSLFVVGSYELDNELPGTNTFRVCAVLCGANTTVPTDSYARIKSFK